MAGARRLLRTGLLADALPLATAIGVFGVVYGAAAEPLLGPWLTVLSSMLIFSGAAQFTMVALLATGAGPAAVLGAVATLGLRHVPLGALLQPHLNVDRRRKGLAALFLIDETTGLALAHDEPAYRTLLVTGTFAYLFWVLGTVGGVAGASLASVEALAGALFPVLFVGLAALTAATRADSGRALVSGITALFLLLLAPGAGALGAIAVAIAVAALVGRR